jgi:hypothetical protein
MARDPIDAYRKGYQKGRADGFADHLGEVLFGSFCDDLGRYYARGYSDGAARKPFNPPSASQDKTIKRR